MKLLILMILLTSYSNQRSQTDDTPNITANGKRVHACGVAVSRDLEDAGFHIGCRVHISGIIDRNLQTDRPDYRNGLHIVNDRTQWKRLRQSSYCNGLYVINDRMHWRKKMQADIFNFDNGQALKFGRQTGTITLLWCE